MASMRVITCNVNGIRAAHAKGFTEWMRRQKPDVVCLQEIKAQEADLPRALLAPRGLHAFFHPAEKRGCLCAPPRTIGWSQQDATCLGDEPVVFEPPDGPVATMTGQ